MNQTNFKYKLPAMEDEELDVSTKIVKVMKLVRMKNVLAMAYTTQRMSIMVMLNVIFNVQAEAGWPTRRACQLFAIISTTLMTSIEALTIKKLYEIKPKKGEDPKVMFDEIEALKVKYCDQVEILDNDTIVMHLFLVCTKLYKSELILAQVEAEVNDVDIMYKNLIRCMNISGRIKAGGKGVMQVGEGKVALTDTEFEGKCHTCGKYAQTKKCPEQNKIEVIRKL